MIRRPPRSTRKESSAASDVYKRQGIDKRKIASELTLKQEGNNIWKVSKFKQFDEEKIEESN
ncbi:hypothetical protein JMUB7538_27110 [Staphylococcus aureus]